MTKPGQPRRMRLRKRLVLLTAPALFAAIPGFTATVGYDAIRHHPISAGTGAVLLVLAAAQLAVGWAVVGELNDKWRDEARPSRRPVD